MAQYIDKDTLVTKIDNLKHKIDDRYSYSHGWKDALRMLEAELNSLEVKEVDLDSNIRAYLTNHFNVYEGGVLQSKKSGQSLSTYDIIKVVKHFFELGLKTQKGE